MTIMTTDTKKILAEIKKAREWVAYYRQWRNEPLCVKKLRAWRRRLKKALAEAAEQKLEVPPDPFAPPPPPPPPPTEEELHETSIAEAKSRTAIPWHVYEGQHFWSPWGDHGWSAITLNRLKRIWCRVSRVNPRTGEITTNKARARRDQLVRRDPALQGRDRPGASPVEILPPPAAPEPEPEPVTEPEPVHEPCPKEEVEPRSPAEEKAFQKRLTKLFNSLSDSDTEDDW